MSRRWVLLAACAIALVAVALPQSGSAQDPCASSAQQRQCSLECCGRLDCTPSCQAICVRACIDACRTPSKQSAYRAKLDEMKARCGYILSPSKVAPK
jgi:hypothetical protein